MSGSDYSLVQLSLILSVEDEDVGVGFSPSRSNRILQLLIRYQMTKTLLYEIFTHTLFHVLV